MDLTHSRVYRNGVLHAEDLPLQELTEHLADPDTCVWMDLCDPSRAQLDAVAGQLGLHDLAVEHALTQQRPKLDHYPSHLFLSLPTARLDPGAGVLRESGVGAFIGDRWLVTVRRDATFDVAPVLERWDQSPDLLSHGVGFLLYGLIDVVVDGYFTSVQDFDDFYDAVSEGIFRDEPIDPSEQRSWFEVRRALVRFHRVVVPLREALGALMRREHGLGAGDLRASRQASPVPERPAADGGGGPSGPAQGSAPSGARVEETIRGLTHPTSSMHPYYQDLYDQMLRVSEATDSLRDLVSSIVETNLSLRDYRQNQVMKKVTSWAAIVAVPTLITGYYGMNVPYPGFARHWGTWASIVLMVACSTALYVSFRRRDWL